MRLKIVSDGLCNPTGPDNGTRLVTEDGEEVQGVVRIDWHYNSDRYLCKAEIEFIGLEVEAEVDAGAVICNCHPANDEVVCAHRIRRAIDSVYGAPRQE